MVFRNQRTRSICSLWFTAGLLGQDSSHLDGRLWTLSSPDLTACRTGLLGLLPETHDSRLVASLWEGPAPLGVPAQFFSPLWLLNFFWWFLFSLFVLLRNKKWYIFDCLLFVIFLGSLIYSCGFSLHLKIAQDLRSSQI